MKKEKTTDKLPDILKPYNEEIKRHMRALGEEFQSRVQVVAENFLDIKKDITEIKLTLGSHTKILNSHSAILDSHSVILESHTEMIGQLMVGMTEIKNDLKTKISHDDFAKLERRVVRLEVGAH